MGMPKSALSSVPLHPCVGTAPRMSVTTVNACYPPIRCAPTIPSPATPMTLSTPFLGGHCAPGARPGTNGYSAFSPAWDTRSIPPFGAMILALSIAPTATVYTVALHTAPPPTLWFVRGCPASRPLVWSRHGVQLPAAATSALLAGWLFGSQCIGTLKGIWEGFEMSVKK